MMSERKRIVSPGTISITSLKRRLYNGLKALVVFRRGTSAIQIRRGTASYVSENNTDSLVHLRFPFSCTSAQKILQNYAVQHNVPLRGSGAAGRIASTSGHVSINWLDAKLA